jgi:succinyl-CoA synthetase alpha subunit
MHKQGVGKFPYFVGIKSLEEIATREDRVCVLNILGSESSSVTPTSHEYSGGNVVFGTGPGLSGQSLPTKLGPIPVFNTVREGIKAGHSFNTGVIFLPPAGVRDGVLELIRHNPELQKVVIITEHVSVKDSRTIRAVCQVNGVDVFGANCLGVADSWNKVRIGGTLGGSKPEETLVKGSVAVYSNSGNFTTTIAVYLLTKGWGTTTCISSGKDLYIQYGPKEFNYAFENDERSKAAVVYAEPGGYYEYRLRSAKPMVACVVGRWKAKITRACGHAGSLAGPGDDARAKEQWFQDAFEVNGIYTPERPVFSKKGAVVTNISHIPEALTAVMAANGERPDFKPQGSLSLKCWFMGNAGIVLPPALDIPVVEAVAPYNEQIKLIAQQVGAQFPREEMRNASGATFTDAQTQVTRLHGVPMLEAAKHGLEENCVLALVKEYPNEKGRKLASIVLNAGLALHGDPAVTAAMASRVAGNSPNAALTAAVSIVGKKRAEGAMQAVDFLTELFQYDLGEDPYVPTFDFGPMIEEALEAPEGKALLLEEADPRAEQMAAAIAAGAADSVFTEFLHALALQEKKYLTADAVVAAAWVTLGWSALKRRRISRHTLRTLPWHSLIYSTIVGASVGPYRLAPDAFCGVKHAELVSSWSFTEAAFLAVFGHRPNRDELFEFSVVLGLVISSGPGEISAQGPKGAVSVDGPQKPERVQVNKCYAGFLTHTGCAHCESGFEAMTFLRERFQSLNVADPGASAHAIDLKRMAREYADQYRVYKSKQMALGNLEYVKIPCVNHPVFRGKDVNIDPREDFIRKLFAERKVYNIFHRFYHELVLALYELKVSSNVYCVTIDAVVAVTLLKILWKPLTAGELNPKSVEDAAFTTFLFGRMAGTAAEIDDHSNRGRDLDMKIDARQCKFIP